MRHTLLAVLAAAFAIAPLAASFAVTDYQCVQACVSHGRLYQDCVARCTITLTPPAAPQVQPVPIPPAPSTSGAAPAPSAPNASQTLPPAATPSAIQTPPLKTQAPPTQVPRNTQAQPKQKKTNASTVPAAQVDHKCVLLCMDHGRLYQNCTKACTHP